MTQNSRSLSASIVVFDIDGVVRDVGASYRRAIADTVEHFTHQAYRPSLADIDLLKAEGIWNNDWEASQELIYRYFEAQGQQREQVQQYSAIVAFFQSRYRGSDPENWNGYIRNEALLLQPSYLEELSADGVVWGFFSGAMRDEANYVLEKRLGLHAPVLVAMEDSPSKPNPKGLLATIQQLEQKYNLDKNTPVMYAGDTVADIYTVEKARLVDANRRWIGVGILPPHVQETPQRRDAYANTLTTAGAGLILNNIQELTPARIQQLWRT